MTAAARDRGALLALLLLIGVLAAASLGLGAGTVGMGDTLRWLLRRGTDDYSAMVLAELRLPRLIKAVIIGAALGAAGVLLQAVTRNPLAETGLLGVNSGAALAVVIGLASQQALTPSAQILWAQAGAMLGGALVLSLAQAGDAGREQAAPLRLVLAGLALGATAQSLMAWITLGRAATLDQFRFWVLGSLAHPHAGLLAPGLGVIALGLLLAWSIRRPLSALGLGDELARALGHRPAPTRAVAVVAVALLAGTAVALAGPIAFLGLIAPFAARALAGVTLQAQLLFSVLIGAALLLLADLVARLIVAPFEAPVSALLALVGAPLLIWMVRRDALLSLTRLGAAE